jgi:hypothetical protein
MQASRSARNQRGSGASDPRKSKPSPKTSIGAIALNSMSRFSTDVVRAVSNRYTKKNGITNLARDVSRLMSVINTEAKRIDLNSGSYNVFDTSSAVIPLPSIANGTTDVTRIGDSVLINKIDMELLFKYTGTAATATNSSQTYRYWCVRYKKTPPAAGTTPFNISEFLYQDAYGNYSPISMVNTDTNENFQVMFCGDVDLQLPTLASTQLAVTKTVTVRHDCHFHQAYNGPLSPNICDNMCFLIVVALNPANAAGSSVVVPFTRFWFVDN